MSELTNANVELANVVAKQREVAELEAQLKAMQKQLMIAKKSSVQPAVENIRKTEKGQVSIYFNIQRWPVTLGREQLEALLKPEVLDQLRATAMSLPTYAERKSAGLTNRNDG